MYEQPYWIEGVKTSEVLARLAERGLSCEGPIQRGETMSEWECEGYSEEDGVRYRASVVGRGGLVRLVAASVEGEAGPPDEAAVDFLAFVTSIPYEGTQRAQARQWVRENTSSGGKLELGSANLELSKKENAHVLRIVSTRRYSEPG
jgi:hypothetical protein